MPVHTGLITQPFYLGKYKMTQGQWPAVIGNNPSHFTGDPNLPVESVSWDDVQEFIHRLNATEGGTIYRLPTEAEWEYAARAGSTSTRIVGDDVHQVQQCGLGCDTTPPVGQLRPNAWGLHDMYDNVYERVQEWYGPYPSGTVIDPLGPASGSYRVVRGCYWFLSTNIC